MEKIKSLVIASGYFNPVHEGHIEYLIQSKRYGDKLIVIINNDIQIEMKGSKEFMNQAQRKYIVENLKPVDYAIIASDDNRLVSNTVETIYNTYKHEYQRFVFTNGGDQTAETIGEKEICEKLGIEMVFGLGEKIQSSSWLLKNK